MVGFLRYEDVRYSINRRARHLRGFNGLDAFMKL